MLAPFFLAASQNGFCSRGKSEVGMVEIAVMQTSNLGNPDAHPDEGLANLVLSPGNSLDSRNPPGTF